jgi:hypothetical protein
VGVEINEAWRDDEAIGVDDFLREAIPAATDLRDLAVLDPQVAMETRDARSVDDRSTFDLNIVFGHLGSLLGKQGWDSAHLLRVSPVIIRFYSIAYAVGKQN